jgi:hypothetical protein
VVLRMNLPWYLSIALHAVLLGRILKLGVWRRYRALTAYLAVSVPRSLLLAAIPLPTLKYFWAWSITEPILWFCSCAVGIEVYRLLCEHYRGIEKIAKNLFVATLVIATLVAAAPLFYEQQFFGRRNGLLLFKSVVFVAHRFVFTGLATFVSAIMIFTLLHPEAIRPNVRRYGIMTALYFTLQTAQALIYTATTRSVFLANALIIPLSAAVIGVWIWFMRAAGEKLERRTASVSRHRIDEFNRQLLDGVRELRP